jgi:hypothetical protein
MIRIGVRARREPAAGVVQPSRQVLETTPRVGGGVSGSAGGVGDAMLGVELGNEDPVGDAELGNGDSDPPSQPMRTSRTAIVSFLMRCPPGRRGG